MRKSLLSVLPAIALTLVLSGCGDSTSSAPTLTNQDRSVLGTLPAQISTEMSAVVDGYAKGAASQATGYANAYKPVAGRTATSCNIGNIDTSWVTSGMTTSMTLKLGKADGSPFGTCEAAASAYTSTGIGMKMTMDMSGNQSGMSMNMHMGYDMTLLPVVSTGGYTINMTMTMTSNTVMNGQTIAMSINPMTMVMTAATKDATPTMDGAMTMTYMDLTISKVKFNTIGIVPSQTIDILKEGSKVATMEIDANGQSVVKDLSGAIITTQG